MIVVVQGTNDFDNYQVFLRSMGVALSVMPQDDHEFLIYSAGPVRINSMVSEFTNISENSMKKRGMKIKNYKVPPQWVSENIEYVNYFAFLSNPRQPLSKLAKEAEEHNIELGIFAY
jgi:hypothetical protein